MVRQINPNPENGRPSKRGYKSRPKPQPKQQPGWQNQIATQTNHNPYRGRTSARALPSRSHITQLLATQSSQAWIPDRLTIDTTPTDLSRHCAPPRTLGLGHETLTTTVRPLTQRIP